MSNSLNRSLMSSWPSQSSSSSSTAQPNKRSRLNLNSAANTSSPLSNEDVLTSDSNPPSPSATTSALPSTSTGSKRRPRPTSSASSSATATGSKRKASSAPSAGPTTSSSREPPTARLSSLGGLHSTIEKMLELVALPLLHPELYTHTGVQPPRGVLLHGPPGCGKTMMANALAGELSMPFISISAPSIVSGMSGESEKTLRETFEEAARIAPCLLFIDEIDAITPKRETAQREMERRIVAQLLTCMDDLAWERNDGKPVIVIGATNRPDSLDPALRRAGRFDCEIAMGVPDEAGREEILKVLCSNLTLSGDFDFRALAKATPGYVGADLASLAGAAGVIAVKRMFKEMGRRELIAAAAARENGNLSQVGAGEVPSGDGPNEGDVSMKEGDGSMIVDGIENGVLIPTQSGTGDDNSKTSDGIPRPTAADAFSLPSPSSTLFCSLPRSILRTPIGTFLTSHPQALASPILSTLSLVPSDFSTALLTLQPSSKREGFATVPDVTWSDIGALHSTRDELHMAVVQPIRRPELFRKVGITAPGGVLLWGPPGCGKTLLAKAVANESRANFISIKGPELLNKYVGESERAVRQVFARARASSPCIIFFDELDALVPRRDDSMSESSARVVNTLLTELDGLESRKGIYVIGATNRPDMIDPAMVRPGRLDKLLYVDLPTPSERVEILRTMTKKTPLASDADRELESFATSERCEGFSGADLAALVREAATLALRSKLESVGAFEVDDGVLQFEGTGVGGPLAEEEAQAGEAEEPILVSSSHFREAMMKVSPSVSLAQRKKYAVLNKKFSGVPTKGGKKEEGLGEPAGAGAGSKAGGLDAEPEESGGPME